MMGPAKSYYHCVDSRYPLTYLTLPELYKQQAERDLGTGIIWHRPPARMTYKEIYNQVLNNRSFSRVLQSVTIEVQYK